jgi:hypothetical protein
MRLEGRQIKFRPPFLTAGRTNVIRLGGSRGSLQLQETALVAEGELIRFRYFGLEWLFRRALSEWTTVTVPYARITTVRYPRFRVLALLGMLTIAVLVGVSVTAYLVADDRWAVMSEVWPVLLVAAVLASLLLFIRPFCRVSFRGKDGRSRVLDFVVRAKRLRKPFLDTLAAHRTAATRHGIPPAVVGVIR